MLNKFHTFQRMRCLKNLMNSSRIERSKGKSKMTLRYNCRASCVLSNESSTFEFYSEA